MPAIKTRADFVTFGNYLQTTQTADKKSQYTIAQVFDALQQYSKIHSQIEAEKADKAKAKIGALIAIAIRS